MAFVPPVTTEKIQTGLAEWYRTAARDLPWRKTLDPYPIWVSEIMLQQTRVETVLDYYRRFLEAFPTVQSLAEASEERLLKLWEGLGYYRRARNMQRAAREVVENHGGRVPSSAAELQALPGIGRYTAAAIASIAFGEQVAVLDGNVKRVLARLFAVDEPVDTSSGEKVLWHLAGELVTETNPGDHNQAVMELGATVCLPRSPHCTECPLANLCKARIAGQVDNLPHRTPKKKITHREAVAAVIRRGDGALLIWKRPGNGMLGGLWELPGGYVESGGSDLDVLQSILEEYFKCTISSSTPAATAKHTYSHFTLAVRAYLVEPEEDIEQNLKEIMKSTGRDLAWLTPGTRDRYALHRAHQKLLEALNNPQKRLDLR